MEAGMSKKRKIDSECRMFNEQWTYDYFFIQCKERAVCLLCQVSLAVFKEYNLRRHYETRHKDEYDSLVGQVRKNKIFELKHELTSRQNAFVEKKQLEISAVRASYHVALLIARAGRPFVDGEFVKECLLAVVKEMCPEKKKLFSTVDLSGPTIAQRIEEMGDNLHQHLQNSSKKLCYFSLALDESNDAFGSAQLLLFIRGTNADFEVTEELVALRSINRTTTGEDIYEKVCQAVNDLELDWAKLAGVTTDGAPSMVDSMEGVVAFINQEMYKQNYSRPIAIHSLIHQQALCCKSLKWDLRSLPEFKDTERKWHIAFLADLTELLNNFNAQLQGKDKLICDMYSHVKAFEIKLELLIRQVREENLCHFPATLKLFAEKPSVPFPSRKCADSLEMLQREIQMRFKEIHFYEQYIQLFHNPFSVNIEIVDPIYQMELVELQSCDTLKDAFKSRTLTEFYESLPSDTYPNLRNHALKMAALFGSTHVCEQTFSRIKHLKSSIRSRLSDAHLHHLLRLAVTNMEPDIDYIISQKQAQTSN